MKDLEDMVESKDMPMEEKAEDTSTKIGVVQDPKAMQKEMMADQPCNRPQTKSNPAMDKKEG